MSKVDSAVAMFNQGFNCAQSILTTYGLEFGMGREEALKLASGFGGGIGRMGDVCGAVSGAFMVIGLKYGHSDAGDYGSKEKTIEMVNEFLKRFNDRNKSIKCRDILGYDLSTEEGRAAVSEEKLTSTLCPDFVKDAAEILEEIL